MKLTFLGANLTVTGSKYLVEESEKRYLVDCGLFQGLKELRLRNREPFPVDPRTISTVILTHAHLDHSGYLPLLYKLGFRGEILSSRATRDLCRILLLDAGRIQEEDARRANKYKYSKHDPALPLYTEKDAQDVLKLFRPIDFNETHLLTKDLSLLLTHSGHILGSSFVTLKNKDLTLVFSGDVGRLHDPILNPPTQIHFADYLVIESTYGTRKHPETDVLSDLESILRRTLSRGGIVIIPSFAVGRAQTVLYYLYKLRQEKRLSDQIPIYLDSPMAQDATDLWCKYEGEHSLSRQECSKTFSIAKYIQSQEESKNLNTLLGPAIILSASGMAEGGRVLHHIAHHASNEENTIMFVGFQAGGSRGGRMTRGEKEIKIHGHMVPIKAEIVNFQALSSHADYEELLTWLKGFEKPPKKIFITHGEQESAESLQSKIQETLGWNAEVPRYLETAVLIH